MAHVVRKVNRAATKGQKKQGNLLKNKLFWIIVSAVVLVAAAITTTVLLVNYYSESETTVNEIDYIGDCEEVKLNKMTYAGLKNHMSTDYVNPQTGETLYVENIIVVAFNQASFFPNEDDNEDSYQKNHETFLKLLVDLQKAVNAQKENGVDVELYILDTNIGSNMAATYDSTIGGVDDTENAIQFLVSYVKEGELYTKKIKNSDNQRFSLVSTTLSEIVNTTLPQMVKFVKGGLVTED